MNKGIVNKAVWMVTWNGEERNERQMDGIVKEEMKNGWLDEIKEGNQ